MENTWKTYETNPKAFKKKKKKPHCEAKSYIAFVSLIYLKEHMGGNLLAQLQTSPRDALKRREGGCCPFRKLYRSPGVMLPLNTLAYLYYVS